jgi:hypothetical protein
VKHTTLFVVASAVIVVAIPAAGYYFQPPPKDPLADRLRSFGFFPVQPPSTLMDVGALYYVSADTSEFTPICHAEKTDLEPVVNESKSIKIEEDLAQDGGLTTKVTLKFGSLVKGASDSSYTQKVHFSLTDVVLQEIALGPDNLIYTKLMGKSECSTVANRLVNTDGYVCQGRKILRATAKYKLDRDSLSKLGGNAASTAGKSDDVQPLAIETESSQKLVARQGELYSGSALDYGVVFTPTCLAPEHSRFARVLPTSRLGRATNYVLYHIVEPLLPPTHDELDVAQNMQSPAK